MVRELSVKKILIKRDSSKCRWAKTQKGKIMELFYIKNTIDERSSQISGYFSTLEKALEALKDCCDWYRSNGTGEIYKINVDELNPKPVFICKDGVIEPKFNLNTLVMTSGGDKGKIITYDPETNLYGVEFTSNSNSTLTVRIRWYFPEQLITYVKDKECRPLNDVIETAKQQQEEIDPSYCFSPCDHRSHGR